MGRVWFKQCMVLSRAWSVLVSSARAPRSLCGVCKLSRSCSAPWIFRKGHVLLPPWPRHFWGRLVQATSCPAVASGHAREDGTLRAAGVLTLWSVLILRQAWPVSSCLLLSAVLPLQPLLPNPLSSVCSPVLLPFPPSFSSPHLASSLFLPYS